MNKWLLILCFAVGLSLAGLQSAHAQYGYGGHCHSHHGHHAAGYGAGYGPGYGAGYSAGYSPYGAGGYGVGYGSSLSYGSGLGYGSYYGSPGLSISRSTYYGGGLNPISPYGVGNYGSYRSYQSALPRVQLRIGF